MITFLSTAERVNNNSTNVMNLDISIPRDHYLKLKNPFPNIKVKYTSKTDKKNYWTLQHSQTHGYGNISTKIIKSSVHLISSPLTYICISIYQPGFFHHT